MSNHGNPLQLCAAAPLSEQLEKDVLKRLNNPKLNIRQGTLSL